MCKCLGVACDCIPHSTSSSSHPLLAPALCCFRSASHMANGRACGPQAPSFLPRPEKPLQTVRAVHSDILAGSGQVVVVIHAGSRGIRCDGQWKKSDINTKVMKKFWKACDEASASCDELQDMWRHNDIEQCFQTVKVSSHSTCRRVHRHHTP